MKKCIYCKAEVDEESVIDFCRPCGIGVFGVKMFETIVKNMEDARERGDLFQAAPSETVTGRPGKFDRFM